MEVSGFAVSNHASVHNVPRLAIAAGGRAITSIILAFLMMWLMNSSLVYMYIVYTGKNKGLDSLQQACDPSSQPRPVTYQHV